MTMLAANTVRTTALAALSAALLLGLPATAAQSASSPAPAGPRVHLNPVIAKLAEGKIVYGISTPDFSFSDGGEAARAPVDFVYADMEHNPFSIPQLQIFLAGMTDKAAIARKGNPGPNVALFARFPPEVDSSGWVVQQALDIGLMGYIFTGTETPEQALKAVKSMRYGQQKGSKYYEPNGNRGGGAGWAWGLSGAEYERRADLWPLNPDGDLLAIVMIESTAAVENVEKIAATPGVGALFVGVGSDLSHEMGVPPGSPPVEAAFARVVAACKANKIGCMIGVNSSPADIVKRINQGWNMIRTTSPLAVEARKLTGEAAPARGATAVQ